MSDYDEVLKNARIHYKVLNSYPEHLKLDAGYVKDLLVSIFPEIVKPLFEEGNWISDGEKTYQVVSILPIEKSYVLKTRGGLVIESKISCIDASFHLWSLKDAVTGDILVSSHNNPFIYNGNYNQFDVGAYGGIVEDKKTFCPSYCYCNWTTKKNIHPATKEEKEFLFKKMGEANYEWDSANLELSENKNSKNTDNPVIEITKKDLIDRINLINKKLIDQVLKEL